MSASNWSQCPQCLARAHKAKEKALQESAEAYGKVSPTDYRRMLLEAESMKPHAIDSMLREDYQLGITESGEFYVTYHAECQVGGCGFKHEFRHEKQLKIKMET